MCSRFAIFVEAKKVKSASSKIQSEGLTGNVLCNRCFRIEIKIGGHRLRFRSKDVAIPEDNGVREKEDEKVEKYQDLAREVRKMWGVKTKVIPVVVGALGSIPLRLNDNLRAIEVGIPVGLIQRCALLGSARILRKVLEM